MVVLVVDDVEATFCLSLSAGWRRVVASQVVRSSDPHRETFSYRRAPYGNFFLSAGLRIWNEHMSVSSTDIMAPALSNSPQ